MSTYLEESPIYGGNCPIQFHIRISFLMWYIDMGERYGGAPGVTIFLSSPSSWSRLSGFLGHESHPGWFPHILGLRPLPAAVAYESLPVNIINWIWFIATAEHSRGLELVCLEGVPKSVFESCLLSNYVRSSWLHHTDAHQYIFTTFEYCYRVWWGPTLIR